MEMRVSVFIYLKELPQRHKDTKALNWLDGWSVSVLVCNERPRTADGMEKRKMWKGDLFVLF
jgi:hypothetical protein